MPMSGLLPMTQVHHGVSCDGCAMPNFSGNRYKCLRCYDFDLCHQCHSLERFSADPDSDVQHSRDHPMQCILTQSDFELLYEGDPSKNYESCKIVVCTCPYCGSSGFSHQMFFEHITKDHPDPPFSGTVNCPLCIGSPEFDSNKEVDNMKHHWITTHANHDPAASTAGATPFRVATADLLAAPASRSAGRRPMLARRTPRQPAANNDRERAAAAAPATGNAAAAVAAAHFGLPWTNEFDDVNELIRVMNLSRLHPAIPADASRPATLQSLLAAGGAVGSSRHGRTLASLAAASVPPSHSQVPSTASTTRNHDYASPRVARSSGNALVPVMRAVAIRPIYNQVDDSRRQDEASTLNNDGDVTAVSLPSEDETLSGDGGDYEGREGEAAFHSAEDLSEQTGEARAAAPSRDAHLSTESEENSHPVLSGFSSEEELLNQLDDGNFADENAGDGENISNLQDFLDPLGGKLPNPWKALRANTSDSEWRCIRRLLRATESEEEESLDGAALPSQPPLSTSAPLLSAEKDEEESQLMWLCLEADSSAFPFAKKSYWKDKRFLKKRKLERQQSSAVVEEGLVQRKSDLAAAVLRAVSSGSFGMKPCEEVGSRGVQNAMQESRLAALPFPSLESPDSYEQERIDTISSRLQEEFQSASDAVIRALSSKEERERDERLDSAQPSPPNSASIPQP